MEDIEQMKSNGFKILIATDTHLGFAEKDTIRGDDSFVTFEEILKIAQEKSADFVLLGGDLFHDNKPSQKALHKCITLLRLHCMGDSPVQFEFLSDKSTNFGHCTFSEVNYEDPNLNISLPVFSIHGNHDDPSANWKLASLDILSATGLVNYFGFYSNMSTVDVHPLLLKKGDTHLAIFGLSAMKDERLNTLLSEGKVKVLRPKEKTDDWFNLMVLHQNHYVRGRNENACIPEALLPSFLDLVVWGHEHECIKEPSWNTTKEFHVLQPGSSVATSLCEGESPEKNVFMLYVFGKKFHLEPIRLKTVRPIIVEKICLSKFPSLQVDDEDAYVPSGRGNKTGNPLSKMVEDTIIDKVKELIQQSIKQRTGHPKQPTLPLIRVRVEYNNKNQVFNPVRIGQNFVNQVANPNEIVLLKKEPSSRSGKVKTEEITEDDFNEAAEYAREEQNRIGEVRVESVVEKYFETPKDVASDSERKKLKVLSITGLIEGVTRYVNKQEQDSMEDVFNLHIKKTMEHLKKEDIQDDENSVLDGLNKLQEYRERNKEKEKEEMINYLDRKTKTSKATKNQDPTTSVFSSDEETDENQKDEGTTKGRGRGSTRARGRGRGGRGARGKAQNTAKAPLTFTQSKPMDSFIQSRKKARSSYLGSSDED